MLKNQYKSTTCLNCGMNINEANYCPHCGQLNSEKRLPVSHFFKDFAGDYLTLDSKIIRSLFPLIYRPGYLTKEYLSGRRVSFIFPIRLYIFITFLFFLIVTVNAKMDKNIDISNTDTNKEQMISRDSIVGILNKKGDVIPADVIDGIVSEMDTVITNQSSVDSSSIKITGLENYEENQNAFADYFVKKLLYIQSLGSHGKSMFYKELINQIPKVLFLLLPVFALILKLLYIRRKILYVEHLIFSLHFHAFIFLILILPVLFPGGYVILFTFVCIMFYLLISIRKFYQQSVIKSILKICLLLFLYFVILLPAAGLLGFLAIISV